MLTNPTLDLLAELGLHGMARGFQDLAAQPDRGLKHADRLALLLEREVTLRRQRRFEARARAARGLDRGLFLRLAACDWIRARQSVLFTGPTGVGKSWLAWATRRRRSESVDAGSHSRTPSARRLARLMTTGRDHLTKSETVFVTADEAGVSELVAARHMVDEFQSMIRRRDEAPLIPWLSSAAASPVASFARGIARDEVAVRAAITSPWSNGQAEGQITKLKLVKRQMYGRGKLDLLEARVIGDP